MWVKGRQPHYSAMAQLSFLNVQMRVMCSKELYNYVSKVIMSPLLNSHITQGRDYDRKILFVLTILRNEFSRFARSMRDGRAGCGAGSSFIMDFNLQLLSH